MANRYVYKDATIEHETDKAVLIKLASGATHWVPKSQLHDNSEAWRKGDTGTVVINGWFAEKENINTEADEEEEDD